MDKHSEIEAKFSADGLDVAALFQYLGDNSVRFKVLGYKDVEGWDCYYEQGGKFLRHRCDSEQHRSILTVKERKSESSIQDRHEIDLPLHDDVTAADVTGFLLMTGWQALFVIDKRSYIFHVKDTSGAVVTLALYDVWPQSGCDPDSRGRRFLEVEVEKDNDCSSLDAAVVLQRWVEELQAVFLLGDPLNESLFEMYRP